MNLNPLSYGLAALRRALNWSTPISTAHVPSLTLSLAVSVAFAVAMFFLSTWIATSPSKADLT
jgi:hypothetical protein